MSRNLDSRPNWCLFLSSLRFWWGFVSRISSSCFELLVALCWNVRALTARILVLLCRFSVHFSRLVGGLVRTTAFSVMRGCVFGGVRSKDSGFFGGYLTRFARTLTEFVCCCSPFWLVILVKESPSLFQEVGGACRGKNKKGAKKDKSSTLLACS